MIRGIRFIRKIARAMRITKEANEKFDSAVRACANVSWNNGELAFIVSHNGPFGFPVVEQIDRPDVVCISEIDNFVVIKDGKVYKIDKRVEYGQ